jgi:hypothetical protein
MRLNSRGVLLALVAVFAMSAIAASAASAALPEFKPVPTKKKFTGSSGEFTLTTPSSGAEFACSKSTTTGEITGASTVGKVVVKFTGCKYTSRGGGGWCPAQSTGAKAEEIVTEPLKGELGSVATTEAPSGAGLLLEPEGASGYLLVMAEVGKSQECEGTIETGMEGNIAGEIATVGKKQLTNKLVFTHPVGGQAKLKKITVKRGSVKVKNTFIGGSLEEWVFGLTDETTFEEALEVT